jgi:hypothetical protein
MLLNFQDIQELYYVADIEDSQISIHKIPLLW